MKTLLLIFYTQLCTLNCVTFTKAIPTRKSVINTRSHVIIMLLFLLDSVESESRKGARVTKRHHLVYSGSCDRWALYFDTVQISIAKRKFHQVCILKTFDG